MYEMATLPLTKKEQIYYEQSLEKDQKMWGNWGQEYISNMGRERVVLILCLVNSLYIISSKIKTPCKNLLRNVSENCAVNGYFIGCCYDGHTIFEALEGRKEDESIGAADDTKKVWEITKKYNSDTFEDNETSVGYAINVYQESINKVFKEYLVNFNYLSYLMNNYGFSIIAQEEAGNMGLPNGTGLFSDLFAYMSKKIAEKELRRADVGKAYQMTPKEKQVSFYNRYFVFKKNKHVEADKILRIMIDKSQTTESASPTPARAPRQAKKRRKKPKKMNKRINIESISST